MRCLLCRVAVDMFGDLSSVFEYIFNTLVMSCGVTWLDLFGESSG